MMSIPCTGKIIAVSVLLASMMGCAQMGPTADKAGSAVGSAFSTVGKGLSKIPLYGDYKTGIEVTPEQMETFKKNSTTKEEIISSIGHPPSREMFNGREVWKYHFTRISHFGPNAFEDTVFEFNKNGTLHSFYKTGGTPGKSGNALLDAAGQ